MQDLVWLEHEADLSETPILKGYDSPFEYLSYRLKCIWEGVSNNAACFQLPGREEGQLWINWLTWFKQFYLELTLKLIYSSVP